MSDAASGFPKPLGFAPAPFDGWLAAAVLVGLTSLGLAWGPLGEPGYLTTSRVPVMAAGVVVVLGWRHGSRRLVRVGAALGLAAVVLAGFHGGGALLMLLALLALRRSETFRATIRDCPPDHPRLSV